MGRMQKKKPASPKKAKSVGDSAPGDIQKSDQVSSVKKDDNSGTSEAKPKKTVLPASGKSSGEQTFLMKLIDRYFGTWIQFLREVRNELSKVVWPTRKSTTGLTAVVLVFVLIVSFFLGVIDFGLSRLVRIIL